MIKEAYPLQWPVGWRREKSPKHSRFGTYMNKPSIHQGTQFIIEELKRLTHSSQDVIISTNLKLRNDGLPYSNQRTPEDQGVAVYFMMKGKQMVIACDSFKNIGCNLYSIGKTIEAMRGIERWGCSELLQRAFTGFQSLPMPSQRQWWEVLEVSEQATTDQIKDAYKNMAKKYHPDMPGGTKEKFQEIQFAYEIAIKSKE